MMRHLPLPLLVLALISAGCADIQAMNDRLMAGSTPEGRCEQGDANSCDGLGWDTQEGRRPAPPTAAFWFEKACALGHRGACNSLAGTTGGLGELLWPGYPFGELRQDAGAGSAASSSTWGTARRSRSSSPRSR
jgi:hypothetical protein